MLKLPAFFFRINYYQIKYLIILFSLFASFLNPIYGQTNLYTNADFIKKLYNDPNYLIFKEKIYKEFKHSHSVYWGEFIKGVNEDLYTKQKIIAFTFDACGREKSYAYDSQLINFLRKQKIPSTLFITGQWIDENYETFLELSKDPLFEIENHGFYHRPCCSNGKSIYGIQGTKNISEAVDEIEANAQKIERITGKKPRFYRSATAYTDEICTKIAKKIGVTIVSYHVLAGDAIPFAPKSAIIKNVIHNLKSGPIIIMHFNHPKWNTYEAMQEIVPELKRQGYSFIKLENISPKKK